MEINEIKIKKDDELKNFNEQELIIYKYLMEKNNQNLKIDIENKISQFEKQKDLIPKIEEKDQNLADNLIKNFYQEKDGKNSMILFTLDNFLNDKENIEKKIKDKKEAIELLEKLNNSLESKIVNPKIIQKINNNSYLCRNQELKEYISQLDKKALNIENKDLTEEQNILCSFRNLIKNSYEDAKNNVTEETTILKLFQDLKFKNIDIQQIINEYDGKENNNIDEKIFEFKSNIKVSSSFYIFLKELDKYNPFNPINNNKNNYKHLFYKIINLLISRYNSYSKLNENNKKISNLILILCHNNLELFLNLINYYILFYNNNIKNDNPKESLNNSLINIVIKVKNLSTSMFSEVICNFISNLTDEMEEIETFANIHDQNIFDACLKKVQKIIKMIFSFFDELRVTSIHREVIYYFNNILTIYFNSLNQKILNVSSYGLEDIQRLLNLSEEILKSMRKNIEKISGQDMSLSVKFMNILEQNLNYLKFQEILFILNSNLKQIKNYLINENYSIYISKEHLLSLLNSTFNQSEKLTEMINLINEEVTVKKK